MTRDEVLIEFHEPYNYEIFPGLRRGGMQLNTDAMADEIVRLRAILAMLREPSDAVLLAAIQHIVPRGVTTIRDTQDIIRAVVAAAEQEVRDDQ